MLIEQISYTCDGVPLKGLFVIPEDAKKSKRPAVIVAHAWRGQDDFARQRAHMLAEWGYIGFAADVYGNGRTVTSDEDARKLMLPLFLDRTLLRKRINAALEAAKAHPLVKQEAIGAIGFCFGGLTVIELLRSGADVRAVVSVHGVLGNVFGEQKAVLGPFVDKLKGALLILHGADDPLVSQSDIQATQQEFTKAKIDWQMHIYGHAKHAFTNPEAHNERAGLVYNEKAAKRAWQSIREFFNEIFLVRDL